MALGGGMSCVKYLLFCFNLLFAVTGIIILIVSIISSINAKPYIDFTNDVFYNAGPILLMIVGVIIFIVAFFGCCGAVKENHCMIITFSAFLLIIFLVELGVGIAGYMKYKDIEKAIIPRLNETLKEYPTNAKIRDTYDIVQTDLSCCGIYGPQDWANNGLTIPDTCCAGQEIKDGKATACTVDSPNIHQNGCLGELVTFFRSVAVMLGGVGIGIAFVQLLGVILACCLARSIRNQYETV